MGLPCQTQTLSLSATRTAPTDQPPVVSNQQIDQNFCQTQSIPLPSQPSMQNQQQFQQLQQQNWQFPPTQGLMPPPIQTHPLPLQTTLPQVPQPGTIPHIMKSPSNTFTNSTS